MTDEMLAGKLPETLPTNPMHWAEAWLDHATREAVQPNPNAMTLVTVGDAQRPSARIVLCKSFVADPGYIVFYTNYESRKVSELTERADVAVVFHWDTMGRQVRLEGVAVRSPAAESDAYFHSRGFGSRLGAWGSDQSRPLGSRDALLAQIRERAGKLGVELDENGHPTDEATIPRPPHWGGIRIWPRRIELWIDGADRIHDRAVWQRTLDASDDEASFEVSDWHGQRLQP
jgi:pyridoxamine 5'-phosphate oxidase